MSRVAPARGLAARSRLASVATAVRAASPEPSSVPATSLSALAQRVLAAVPASAGAMTLHRFWTMPTAQRPLFVVAAELVRDWPHLADQIVDLEDEAQPNLQAIEGLWGRTVKGTRGAIPRPGSMAVFIRALREDPDLLQRYLAMAPPLERVATADVGGVPQFRPPPPASWRHLPMIARSAA